MNTTFNMLDTDVLKEISNIGTGSAATSMSKLINQRISMTVPEVRLLEFKNLADIFNGPETLVAGILVNIYGDINGLMMYIMLEQSACNLINNLLKTNKHKIAEFDQMDYSALTEIGNILTSSYLTAMSSLLNLKISKSVPSLSIDMAGALLSVPAIEFGRVSDKVLFIESTFNENKELSGYFMLIPDLNAQDAKK